MTVGLHGVNLANKWLNMLRGVAFTAPSGVWIQLHTGDPGSAGTAAVSALTTRNQVTWSAASGGSLSLSALADFTMTATETISHTSAWDASTSGNFLFSGALSFSRSIVSGDLIRFSTYSVTASPLAA